MNGLICQANRPAWRHQTVTMHPRSWLAIFSLLASYFDIQVGSKNSSDRIFLSACYIVVYNIGNSFKLNLYSVSIGIRFCVLNHALCVECRIKLSYRIYGSTGEVSEFHFAPSCSASTFRFNQQHYTGAVSTFWRTEFYSVSNRTTLLKKSKKYRFGKSRRIYCIKQDQAVQLLFRGERYSKWVEILIWRSESEAVS